MDQEDEMVRVYLKPFQTGSCQVGVNKVFRGCQGTLTRQYGSLHSHVSLTGFWGRDAVSHATGALMQPLYALASLTSQSATHPKMSSPSEKSALASQASASSCLTFAFPSTSSWSSRAKSTSPVLALASCWFFPAFPFPLPFFLSLDFSGEHCACASAVRPLADSLEVDLAGGGLPLPSFLFFWRPGWSR